MHKTGPKRFSKVIAKFLLTTVVVEEHCYFANIETTSMNVSGFTPCSIDSHWFPSRDLIALMLPQKNEIARPDSLGTCSPVLHSELLAVFYDVQENLQGWLPTTVQGANFAS